jgi:hypothetical protein
MKCVGVIGRETVVDFVEVAHLAAAQKCDIGEMGFQ